MTSIKKAGFKEMKKLFLEKPDKAAKRIRQLVKALEAERF